MTDETQSNEGNTAEAPTAEGEAVVTEETAGDWKDKDPFGGKRYKRLKDPKNINVSIERDVLDGCEKLAYLATRNLRDWIRMTLKGEVELAIKEGRITPGPLRIEEDRSD